MGTKNHCGRSAAVGEYTQPILKDIPCRPMFASINARFRKFKYLWAHKFFLNFYYGERLRDYPLSVSSKMLLSRASFLSLIPFFLPDKYFLMNYHGAKMYINLFATPIAIDRGLEVYEYWMTKLFRSVLREGMTVLDIGAHKGTYSVLFASLMNDKGKVLAFEPDPANYNWIWKNIQANDFKSIEVYPFALADNEGNATFYPADGMGSLFPHFTSKALGKAPMDVKIRRLDNFLQEKNIRDVDVIKMDVEGADLLVLRGAENTLRTTNLRLFMDVDVHTNSERRELFELLSDCGFEIYRIGKKLGPVKSAEQLFLCGDDRELMGQEKRQIVREIYASKFKGGEL
jgi:FkbM family methyltransferase